MSAFPKKEDRGKSLQCTRTPYIPTAKFVPNSIAPTAQKADVLHTSEPLPQLTFTHAVALLESDIPIRPQSTGRGNDRGAPKTGIDLAHFGTAPRLAAWSVLAPGMVKVQENRAQARSTKRIRAARGLNAACPWSGPYQGAYLSALYRRLAARRGKRRAILAVAHSIMVSVFPMLTRNAPYHELGGNCYPCVDVRRRPYKDDRLDARIGHWAHRVQVQTFPRRPPHASQKSSPPVMVWCLAVGSGKTLTMKDWATGGSPGPGAANRRCKADILLP